ncbi:MAG TPA: pilus assembly protein TadG-related protein [Catenuloplanes sp.]
MTGHTTRWWLSRWRRLREHARDDRGSATGWAIGMMLVTMLLIFLVVDGGRAMTAKVAAVDAAQQAARAGADQLDLLALRTTGAVRLDPAAAQAAAEAFLANIGASGTASATAESVTVTVTRTDPTLLLNQVGVPRITLSATAIAQPVTT